VSGLSASQGIVLANLQVPQAANVKVHQGFRINDPCRWRGMVALDATNGELRWEQRPLVRNPITGRLEYPELRRRGDRDAVVPRLDVPGPPAIVDDVVFALGHFFEGAINTYLVALDLATGEPFYAVPLVIGQQELSMFNMPFQEFTTGCPSFWNGTVFCSTNVGLAAAVDATFGDLRWLSEYEALRIVPPDNYFRNQPRPVYWYNRGPLAADDLLLVTPHDSRYLVALDPSTGRERFSRELPRRDHRYPTSHFLGVTGGCAIVATGGVVIAVKVDDGLVKWTYPAVPRGSVRPVELLGSGVVTDRHVWLPTADDLVILDAEDGSEVERSVWDPEEPRSLLLFPDMLIAAGKSSVVVAFDPAEALRELRRQVERDGESTELLVRIGSLERQAGDLARAASTLRRAVALASGGRSLAAADVARVRGALCGALRDLAEQESRVGRREVAEAALLEAESVADDAETRAAVVRELLVLAADDAAHERALRWLARMRADFATARVMVPELSPRPVTVGIWTGLALADLRKRRGELALALAELQSVQVDWPAEPLAERDSVAVAHAAVDDLLARAPAELRRKYDDDARAAFAAAVEARDIERLALLLRRFPSAASAPEYAARELELLRSSRRPVDALSVGAELLRARPSASLARAATTEYARAARDVGNDSLARALVRRLAVAPEGEVPDDLRALADSREAPQALAGTLELVRDVDLAENAVVLGGSDRPLRGEPLPDGFRSVLVLEPGTSWRIARLRLPEGERLWEAVLPRARMNDLQLQALHVAGTLVARRGSTLLAFDLESGATLWQSEYEREIVELSSAAGVLLFTQRMPQREGMEGDPVVLAFVEPRTGRQIASAALSGVDTRVGQLLGSGASCVVSSFGRLGQAAEVFDAATGARRFDPHAYPAGLGVPVLLEEAGLLVLPDSRPAPGDLAGRQGGAQRLNAFALGDGALRFSVDLLPVAYKLRYFYGVADGLAVLGGTPPDARILQFDSRTGEPLGPAIPLPAGINEGFRRVLVPGEEPVRIQGFAEQRRGEPVSLVALTGAGQELWRRTFEVPKNTVSLLLPDRLLRHGSALLFALQMHAGGKYRTEIIVVDADGGAVLDRDGFDGGRAGQRDDLVRIDEFVALRQERVLHVLGWR